MGPFFYNLFLSVYTDKKIVKKYEQLRDKYNAFEHYSDTLTLIDCHSASAGIANKIFLYNYNVLNLPVYITGKIDFLASPLEHIQALINLINKAQKFIHMEYYIFGDGYVTNYLLSLLEKKIQEGVKVKMLVDYYGNFWRLSKKTIKKIKKIGISFKYFNPIFKTHSMWWHHRDHNKIMVVDNKHAFYGSCNIADEYFNITTYFFQTAESSVILEGPIVNSLNVVFATHWNMNKPYLDEEPMENTLIKYDDNVVEYDVNTTHVQFINSCPLFEEKYIKNNLLQLIYAATEEIIIVTPYFCPSKDIIEALKVVSHSGIKVRILVPKQSDFFYINRRSLLELLNSKVEVYEHFGFNHEKVTVIDRQLVHFGTYNWDYRALYLNFETALLIKGDDFMKKILKNLLQKFNNSHKISFEDLRSKKSLKNSIHNNLISWGKPFL